jgi:hypothetical protein
MNRNATSWQDRFDKYISSFDRGWNNLTLNAAAGLPVPGVLPGSGVGSGEGHQKVLAAANVTLVAGSFAPIGGGLGALAPMVANAAVGHKVTADRDAINKLLDPSEMEPFRQSLVVSLRNHVLNWKTSTDQPEQFFDDKQPKPKQRLPQFLKTKLRFKGNSAARDDVEKLGERDVKRLEHTILSKESQWPAESVQEKARYALESLITLINDTRGLPTPIYYDPKSFREPPETLLQMDARIKKAQAVLDMLANKLYNKGIIRENTLNEIVSVRDDNVLGKGFVTGSSSAEAKLVGEPKPEQNARSVVTDSSSAEAEPVDQPKPEQKAKSVVTDSSSAEAEPKKPYFRWRGVNPLPPPPIDLDALGQKARRATSGDALESLFGEMRTQSQNTMSEEERTKLVFGFCCLARNPKTLAKTHENINQTLKRFKGTDSWAREEQSELIDLALTYSETNQKIQKLSKPAESRRNSLEENRAVTSNRAGLTVK